MVADLNVLNLASWGGIFVGLGGLYSSLKVLAVIMLSGYTTNRYHKRIARELKQNNPVFEEWNLL